MRTLGSDYLAWAKRAPSLTYSLIASGLPSRTMAELAPDFGKLELSGVARYGHAPLVDAIARLHEVDRDCVVTAAGCSLANHLALAALVEPGDEVLIERPTYEPLVAQVQFLGARVTRFERAFTDEYRVDPQAIARALGPRTRLVVITNLHNPSGVLTDAATLAEVGALAEAHGARVLVDEVYLDAVPGARTALHLGPRFVVTSSLTKVYGLTGLRCGWVLAEPALAQRLWRLTELFTNHDPFATMQLATQALERVPAWRREVQALLFANHALVNRFLDGRDDLETVRPGYGTLFFPRLVRGSVDALCARLSARESAVVPGSFFDAPDHFRIGVGLSPEILQGGLERLEQALDELARV
jgi:aspartate/methionine/tyrosine aminotransferase